MTALSAHLSLVHVPVVGMAFVALGLAVALARRDMAWVRLFEGALLVVAVLGVLAYVTGGQAYEALPDALAQATQNGIDTGTPAKTMLESHAVLGKGAFVLLLVLAAGVVALFLQSAQGAAPSVWAHVGVLVGAAVVCWLLVWAAHLGGHVRHTELGGAWSVFPAL